MNETALRLKAIIGSLKLVALAVLIIATILLFVGLEDLSTALKNPDEGATPPGMATGLIMLVLGGIAGFLSTATFFFPSTVFAPGPLPTPDTPAPVEVKPQVKATGRFLKLKRVRPSIEMGRGTRKFRNSVANIVPLAERKLMIYIHHILKSKYGVTLRKTHWGVFIEPSKVIDIEGGKLYGWKNRWAVRFTYTGHKDKPETLIVSFDKVWGQLKFVNLLQKLGFIPGAGVS